MEEEEKIDKELEEVMEKNINLTGKLQKGLKDITGIKWYLFYLTCLNILIFIGIMRLLKVI